MLHYCKKCGRIAQESYTQKVQKCDCCETIMLPVPPKYLFEGFDIAFKDKETERLLIEELVKTSPEFDQYLFDHRDEILAKQSVEFNAKMEHGRAVLENASRKVTCPYCKSTNVKKIGQLNRTVSTGLFGLGSKKIGKQWHCNGCGSDF
ncbi:MAG: IS1 family transposase [Lachnospiraceae bacterium]|nr:IS1 family transposase [Lachnospiraceae bacterium]